MVITDMNDEVGLGEGQDVVGKGRVMRDIVVFDTANEPYLENKIFDPAIASRYPGAMAMYRFHELATSAGYQVMTADCAGKEDLEGNRLLVISEQVTPRTESLRRKGALLAALICLETPSFAWRFYRDLHRISRWYRHAFLFPGASKWVDVQRVQFHPALFPQPDSHVSEAGQAGWNDRMFMTMINSNLVRYVRPLQWLASLAKPELRGELYSERRKAIRYFSKDDGFHLYGRGWDRKRFMVSGAEHQAALRCYKGACGDKVETLARYRFAICFENAVFPGYITEKIFDCFYAGCVPVYYGAPDIDDYIPKACFIDFRDFSDYRELERFLSRMGPDEFEAYRGAAADFLNSRAFERFSYDYFASHLLSAMKECAA